MYPSQHLKILDFNQKKKGNLVDGEEPDRALMWHKARKGKLNDEELDPELAEVGRKIVSISIQFEMLILLEFRTSLISIM